MDSKRLSFDIAGLLLIWALKPCDRAGTALSGLCQGDAELSTVGSGWNSSSLGADGRLVLGSLAPSLSRPEGRRRVGTDVPGGSGLLGPGNVFHADCLSREGARLQNVVMSTVSGPPASISVPWEVSRRSEAATCNWRRSRCEGLMWCSWGLGGFRGGSQRRSLVTLAPCRPPRQESGRRLRSGTWSRPPAPRRPALAHLVVSPAGLPDAQRLGLGELPLEAEQEPAVAEEHLQAVLAQRHQVLIEAQVCQPQQLPQVQLR